MSASCHAFPTCFLLMTGLPSLSCLLSHVPSLVPSHGRKLLSELIHVAILKTGWAKRPHYLLVTSKGPGIGKSCISHGCVTWESDNHSA